MKTLVTPTRLEAILSRVTNPMLSSSDTWVAQCPAHNDEHNFSLSITQRKGHYVKLICLAGCTQAQILGILGLGATDHPDQNHIEPAPGYLVSPVRQPETLITPVQGIDILRADLAKWLSIPPEDSELVDFCLAVYKSNEIPGDPLWGIIIDASGAGKTELLRAFRKRPDAYFLSKLSEKTFGQRIPRS